MEGYQDLLAWQKAVNFVGEVYDLTKLFPREEEFGLKVQLRRAAVSVPSNIAEGQGRNTKREFHHFLGNARGSLYEAQTQIHIAHRLRYITNKQRDSILRKADDAPRLINGLRQWLSKPTQPEMETSD